jgi:hypothetical protein
MTTEAIRSKLKLGFNQFVTCAGVMKRTLYITDLNKSYHMLTSNNFTTRFANIRPFPTNQARKFNLKGRSEVIFKVCKSVHHRTIQINHQPDATIFQFIILTYLQLNNVLGVLPLIIRSSMTAVAASGFTFVSW